MVNGYYNASGGVLPWIKIINDTAVAVNQQGRRAGAVTVAFNLAFQSSKILRASN